MSFSVQDALDILERTPKVIANLTRHMPEKIIHATEGPDTWSPFDILGHLLHGEKTDWIPRMQIILSDSEKKTFEPYDRFAQFTDSKGKSFLQLLEEFETLREVNIKTLKAANPSLSDLGKKGIHPAFGEVTLSQLLATWAVHDLNHLAQLSRVMAKQYSEEVGPWKAYLGILNK